MKIQKVKLPSGQIKYEVRTLTNGRGSSYLRRRFDTRADAEQFGCGFVTRAKETKNLGMETKNFEDTTFEEEAREWLDHGSIHFRPSHLKRVRGIIEEFLPTYGNYTLNRFTPGFLTKLQRTLKTTNVLKSEKLKIKKSLKKNSKKVESLKPPANATVNRKIEVITSILNFSANQKRIPFNPCAKFAKLPDRTPEMLFWERSEAESFLTFAGKKYPFGSENRWVYVVYLTALNAILRAAEIWGLQPQDITDHNTLFVRRQFEQVAKEFSPLKSKDGRDSFRHVPCSNELKKELVALIVKNNIRPDQTIFRNQEGNPIDHDNFAKRYFSRDVKEWGGKQIRFHDLRHTGTTLLIVAGVDLKMVKEICGHKVIDTTMRYSHLIGGNVSKVVEVFSISAPESAEIPKLHVVS